ncbi:hypothetical protein DHEL01_v208097 [Diaporthe helianthi]|uniref:Uncharacterized protein n=1 Tax=Diaporthe helianthi TaxID=158607 RepID=A0A2P5HTD7_DIAHE|nr:hypothetical protein DHEL01_v208097 [Diaporthe helianthi]
MAAVGSFQFLLVVSLAARATADDGDDFSNNLFSDLTPLLSLFGERVTMQFMSQSMGWADNFMLAMAPLGIITIIVSAIRVGGPTLLKNIIGRGRENLAIAEAEIMSSTSHEDGPSERDEEKANGATLPVTSVTIVCNDTSPSPNISLNSHNNFGRLEIRFGAVIGSVLQLGVLVYGGFATYYPSLQFYKNDSPVADYAFPCTAIGTIILVVGMLLCAHVVDFSTKETRYTPAKEQETRLVWLQQTKTVNDQHFTSHAVWAPKHRQFVTVSSRETANKILTLKTVAGTSISFCGYVIQFIGLRGMHWSASITQLGAVLVMTGLRAFVRRGLAHQPAAQILESDFELDWFALNFQSEQLNNDTWPRPSKTTEKWIIQSPSGHSQGLEDHTDSDSGTPWDSSGTSRDSSGVTSVSGSQRIMKLRRDLGFASNWPGTASQEAVSVARAVEITMDALLISESSDTSQSSKRIETSERIQILTWSMEVHDGESVKFRLQRQLPDGKWKAFADEIDAALSLWLFSVHQTEHEEASRQQGGKLSLSKGSRDDDAWLRAKGSPAEPSLRLLGLHTPGLHRDLWWWMQNGTARVMVMDLKNDEGFDTGVKEHRILGHCTKPLKIQFLPPETKGGHAQQGRWLGKPTGTFSHSGEEGSEGQSSRNDAAPTHYKGQAYGSSLLTTTSYAPLKLVYAQEIFSAFMWSLAKIMKEPIQGVTHFRPDETSSDNSWHDITLDNDSISRLALDVESTGLGGLQDVYTLVLPPLSEYNRLLTAESIFEFTKQNAKRHELLGNWDETCDAYLWLFRTANTYPAGSSIVTKATALLLEHLRQITLAVESMEPFDENTNHMLGLQLSLENELQSADSNTLQALVMLYEAQRRPWKRGQDLYPCQDQDTPLFPRMRPHLSTYNFTGLHIAILMEFGKLNAELEQVKRETAHGRDIHDWTPLHYAAANTLGWHVKKLLDKHAYVNARDMLEWTPLHYVCLNQRDEKEDDNAETRTEASDDSTGSASDIPRWVDTVRVLLYRGADINAQGRDGVTPLHCATMNGHRNMVLKLVQAGAVVDVPDILGRTPLFLAAQRGHMLMVMDLWDSAMMKRDKNGRTASHYAASSGNAEIVNWLVDQDSGNVKVEDRRGRTPLHYAALNGRTHILKPLIQGGAKVNARDEDYQTPLLLAAVRGHVDVVEKLKHLSAPTDVVNASGDNMRTALHFAAMNGHNDVVKWLLRNGAERNVGDNANVTALHLAVASSHKSVVESLLSFGARYDIQDFGDQTAFQLAQEIGKEEIIDCFRRKGATITNT